MAVALLGFVLFLLHLTCSSLRCELLNLIFKGGKEKQDRNISNKNIYHLRRLLTLGKFKMTKWRPSIFDVEFVQVNNSLEETKTGDTKYPS